MNAEQREGMALNKDFWSKTGNGSVSREGRAIATPTGEQCRQIPSLPPSIYLYLFLALLLLPALSSSHILPHWVLTFQMHSSKDVASVYGRFGPSLFPFS